MHKDLNNNNYDIDVSIDKKFRDNRIYNLTEYEIVMVSGDFAEETIINVIVNAKYVENSSAEDTKNETVANNVNNTAGTTNETASNTNITTPSENVTKKDISKPMDIVKQTGIPFAVLMVAVAFAGISLRRKN